MGVSNKIDIPPSKSIINRLLIIEAIGNTKVLKKHHLCCEDTQVLYDALFTQSNKKNIKQSGTAMRFLTAFLSTQKGEFILDGSERIRNRPIAVLVDAINMLGGDIQYMEKNGFLPIKIDGKKFKGGKIFIDASQSSQFVSALMLIAPTLEKGLIIEMKNITSFPYVLLTKNIMEQAGIEVELKGNNIFIKEQNYNLKTTKIVESDFSSAVFWFAFLIITDMKNIVLENFMPDSPQPDKKIIEIVKQLGIITRFENGGIYLEKNQIVLPKNIHLNFKDTPDITPIMVALCCLLDIEFVFEGIVNLQLKESNRVDALIDGFKQCGYLLGKTDDTIFYEGHKCVKCCTPIINTYSDHRIAMAFALVSLKIDLTILDKSVVYKSYPLFWQHFEDMKKGLVQPLYVNV